MMVLYHIHCKRSQHRSEITSAIHADFSLVDKQQLVVHWDRKIIADTTNKAEPKSKVDRLAVIVTGRELEKILGIVKLPSGTGKAPASATHQPATGAVKCDPLMWWRCVLTLLQLTLEQ